MSRIFLFIPISLFVYQLFFGHILKDKTWYISVSGIGFNLAVALSFLYRTFLNTPNDIMMHYRGQWLATENFNIDLGISIDN